MHGTSTVLNTVLCYCMSSQVPRLFLLFTARNFKYRILLDGRKKGAVYFFTDRRIRLIPNNHRYWSWHTTQPTGGHTYRIVLSTVIFFQSLVWTIWLPIRSIQLPDSFHERLTHSASVSISFVIVTLCELWRGFRLISINIDNLLGGSGKIAPLVIKLCRKYRDMMQYTVYTFSVLCNAVYQCY